MGTLENVYRFVLGGIAGGLLAHVHHAGVYNDYYMYYE